MRPTSACTVVPTALALLLACLLVDRAIASTSRHGAPGTAPSGPSRELLAAASRIRLQEFLAQDLDSVGEAAQPADGNAAPDSATIVHASPELNPVDLAQGKEALASSSATGGEPWRATRNKVPPRV